MISLVALKRAIVQQQFDPKWTLKVIAKNVNFQFSGVFLDVGADIWSTIPLYVSSRRILEFEEFFISEKASEDLLCHGYITEASRQPWLDRWNWRTLAAIKHFCVFDIHPKYRLACGYATGMIFHHVNLVIIQPRLTALAALYKGFHRVGRILTEWSHGFVTTGVTYFCTSM